MAKMKKIKTKKKIAKKSVKKVTHKKRPTKKKATKKSPSKISPTNKKAQNKTIATPKFIIPSKGTLVGEITHFYSEISVGIIKASRAFNVGDTLEFKGTTTDFVQKVESMQFNHQSITQAPPGSEVGVKIKQKVREGDKVYKI